MQVFFLSIGFGFWFFLNRRCGRKVCDLWRLSVFSEPEIVAVRTTVDVINAGAVSDLQFLRQSGVFYFSFFVNEPSTENETVPALHPAVFSPHFLSRSGFSADIPTRRWLGFYEASVQCGESCEGRQDIPACMAVPGRNPQDNEKEHRAGRVMQSSAGSWHQVSRQHPPGKLPAEVLLLFSNLTSDNQQEEEEEQVHREARSAIHASQMMGLFFRQAAHC